jgi:hypothetical protein
MQIPARLATPQIKLGYGEQVLRSLTSRRKKVFASRYGELHLTNQRIAFVAAVASTDGVSPWGVKPSIVFDRSAIRSVDKVAMKRGVAIEIRDHRKTERFVVEDEAEVDTVIALLS